MVKNIKDKNEKTRISRFVLEALPEWFGIERSREEYISASADQEFFAYFSEEKPVGFLCLKGTGKDTAGLSVMGVLKEYHRLGIGTKLFLAARNCAAENGYSFLQVKTVKAGIYKEYDITNKFYESLGFKEFEVFPLLWDKNNPCQIYVMSLLEARRALSNFDALSLPLDGAISPDKL